MDGFSDTGSIPVISTKSQKVPLLRYFFFSLHVFYTILSISPCVRMNFTLPPTRKHNANLSFGKFAENH